MQWFFLKLFIRRSINTFAFIAYYPLDSLVFLATPKETTQRTAIIKLGAIGDYILFRNFLPELHRSRGKLTLIISKEIVPLCKYLDSEFVDEIVPVDATKMETNPYYRFKLLSKIRKMGMSTMIQASFSRRALVEDAITRACNSKLKITPNDEGNHIAYHLKRITDQFYDQVIKIQTISPFEYLKNHSFVEQIVGSFKLPQFEIDTHKEDKNTIAVFPGAGRPYRRWAPEKFAQISTWLIKNTNYKLLVLGSKADFDAGEIIKDKNEAIINMCGKVTIMDSIKFIAASSLVLGNESGPAHIGAALGIPTIVISNGNHYGRFHPYPNSISDKIHTVYPPEFEIEVANTKPELLVKKYRLRSLLDINEVKIDQVISLLKVII
ncbi:MAG: glycosyltransferase family 9 protein [Cyclobacteriaceae bacterium]